MVIDYTLSYFYFTAFSKVFLVSVLDGQTHLISVSPKNPHKVKGIKRESSLQGWVRWERKEQAGKIL